MPTLLQSFAIRKDMLLIRMRHSAGLDAGAADRARATAARTLYKVFANSNSASTSAGVFPSAVAAVAIILLSRSNEVANCHESFVSWSAVET